jgi:hypothetical protein
MGWFDTIVNKIIIPVVWSKPSHGYPWNKFWSKIVTAESTWCINVWPHLQFSLVSSCWLDGNLIFWVRMVVFHRFSCAFLNDCRLQHSSFPLGLRFSLGLDQLHGLENHHVW